MWRVYLIPFRAASAEDFETWRPEGFQKVGGIFVQKDENGGS
jgi:hypothetical protein